MLAYFACCSTARSVFINKKDALREGFLDSQRACIYVCSRSFRFWFEENLIKQIAAIFSFQFSTREAKRDFYVKSANTRAKSFLPSASLLFIATSPFLAFPSLVNWYPWLLPCTESRAKRNLLNECFSCSTVVRVTQPDSTTSKTSARCWSGLICSL